MPSTYPSSASGRKPKGGGPQRREEILAQALILFSEHGVHTVTTRQIAATVGISQSSLYAYFPTKQALVAEVSGRAFSALSSRMTQALERSPGPGVLGRLARVYIDFGLTQPDAYRIAFMIESSHKRAGANADAALGAGVNAFTLYREAIASRLGVGLAEDEIDVLAQSRWAALHGLVSLIIARPGFPWVDQQRLIDQHVRRLFGPD